MYCTKITSCKKGGVCAELPNVCLSVASGLSWAAIRA